MNELGEGLYQAQIAKMEAEAVEARAILKVYFNSPVGIGEHPDLLTEINKYCDKLAQAEDKIESLKRNFGPSAKPPF
jgi:hypothetical protein|tara:strand:- start:281 stop:511 length:231 start_codon:yes stop_codon:yes gene_type:complete